MPTYKKDRTFISDLMNNVTNERLNRLVKQKKVSRN